MSCALLLVASLLLQDPPPPLPPLPEVPKEAPLVDVDGTPLVKGKLPASTKPAAREVWERFVAASGAGDAARRAVSAFDLEINLRIRTSDSNSNELPDARYAWLGPNWILADTGRGRRQMRGPKGSWLLETKAGVTEAKRLDVGRENAEDRRQLDDALDVARLFASLVDPRSLRVQKLVRRETAPTWLPEKLATVASGLAWLEITTPDVRPGTKAQPAPGARMLLGFARDDGLVRIALVDGARAAEELTANTVCADMDRWRAIDGYQVPHHLVVFLPSVAEASGSGARAAIGWRAQPALDLVVKRGSLAPTLKPEEFTPPADAKIVVD